eukprot:gb/GFBE01009663.1/.p1 GENE.gb/GFBE01009663.1/~~gb/GFBE01009663.1/.p1  ORF type:complete len:309 (+),score=47.43 gb/GFBE01009663.1/:1-927(+)
MALAAWACFAPVRPPVAPAGRRATGASLHSREAARPSWEWWQQGATLASAIGVAVHGARMRSARCAPGRRHPAGAGQRVACRAAPSNDKPGRTTLYTKAGPDGTELGDCPFSHSVQMALRLKGVDFDIVPCSKDTKPQWLLDEVDGKMPCVCHEGTLHVETSDILAWIDEEFPEPSLAVPDRFRDVIKSSGMFPAIAAYTKSTDSEEDDVLKVNLQVALARLRNHMFDMQSKFLCGDEPTLLDCDLLTKLYILDHATPHFKGLSIMDFPEHDEVRSYYERGSALKAFADSAYPKEVGIWGWEQARGGK